MELRLPAFPGLGNEQKNQAVPRLAELAVYCIFLHTQENAIRPDRLLDSRRRQISEFAKPFDIFLGEPTFRHLLHDGRSAKSARLEVVHIPNGVLFPPGMLPCIPARFQASRSTPDKTSYMLSFTSEPRFMSLLSFLPDDLSLEVFQIYGFRRTVQFLHKRL